MLLLLACGCFSRRRSHPWILSSYAATLSGYTQTRCSSTASTSAARTRSGRRRKPRRSGREALKASLELHGGTQQFSSHLFALPRTLGIVFGCAQPCITHRLFYFVRWWITMCVWSGTVASGGGVKSASARLRNFCCALPPQVTQTSTSTL